MKHPSLAELFNIIEGLEDEGPDYLIKRRAKFIVHTLQKDAETTT